MIIPIKGMIERGLLNVFKRGLAQAVEEDIKIIILDMDTPGGRVQTTEQMIRLLIDLPDDIKTYTFVNKDALSAGALIALSTGEIYMAPGSRIGASAIVTAFGDMKEGDMKEKHLSSTQALIKSAAKHNGHDENVVEAMMRMDFEYKIGDKIICPAGQLLVLTDMNAHQEVTDGDKTRPLLSAGNMRNMEELKKTLGIENATFITLTSTTAEKIARYIEMLSILFLAGGLLGIYIEFKTPGFGIPGLTGMLLLAIFFWGHNVVGLSGTGEVILFMLGIILLIIEIFVIPGFGIAGVSGIVLIIASILMAMIEHPPSLPWYQPPTEQLEKAVFVLSAALVLSFILVLLIARFLPDTSIFRKIVLEKSLDGTDPAQASKNQADLIGLKGIAGSSLHPAGIGEFGDKRLDVIAKGEFIDKNTPIIIAETHGNRIVVDAV
ncbi:MAG: hypothetical protein KAH23_07110 [Kiritimatiellae bacterium]|nr:hypothetical protein [Kiritimatiellia bacterium]